MIRSTQHSLPPLPQRQPTSRPLVTEKCKGEVKGEFSLKESLELDPDDNLLDIFGDKDALNSILSSYFASESKFDEIQTEDHNSKRLTI